MKDVRSIHALADRLAEEIVRLSSRTPVCCRGCSSCCREAAYVVSKEAVHAVSSIPPGDLAWVKARSKDWFDRFNAAGLSSFDEPHVSEYRRHQLECPLLKGGICLVYHNRPVCCRLHIAIGPRERCDQDGLRLTQEFVTSPEAAAFIGQSFLKPKWLRKGVTFDHLGLFLAQYLLGLKAKSRSRVTIYENGTVDG